MTPKNRAAAKRQATIWLSMGWPRHLVDEHLHRTFNATPEDTTLIIKEIRHEQQQSLTIERQEFLAQQMTRLEALAVKAQEEGQLGVALGAFRELNALAKLYAP